MLRRAHQKFPTRDEKASRQEEGEARPLGPKKVGPGKVQGHQRGLLQVLMRTQRGLEAAMVSLPFVSLCHFLDRTSYEQNYKVLRPITTDML
jgi:hypothetical protein